MKGGQAFIYLNLIDMAASGKKELTGFWRTLTNGNRKYVTMPIFLIFIIIPALAGLIIFYQQIYGFLSSKFSPDTTEISPQERELIVDEEWGLIIASYEKKEKAEKEAGKFKQDYFRANHLDQNGKPVWQNDIHVVRDPDTKGRWVIVLDMNAGKSTRKELQDGIIEVLESERKAGVRGRPLARWLNRSAPYEFSIKKFEETYGRITNLNKAQKQ